MGEGTTTENRTWRNMLDRCYNSRCSAFKMYGGRGIKVCESWRDGKRNGPGSSAGYRHFLKDMGRKPTRLHVLDRIDVNGPYSPENCRWTTPAISRLNKRHRGLSPEERKKLLTNVIIPIDLHMRMKLFAAENGMFLEAVMDKAVRQFLKSNEQKEQ